ncbi:MAG: o-succinylbenzoate--CoA ligase [Candidatus Hydrogenedentes bacterium]|nr:o-succinylbenzoate--CoA ligase [Candidatus Hydrogenedentota bacterium]
MLNHPCPLRTNACATPHAPALITPHGQLSYADLDEAIARAAGVFAEALPAGARVAIVSAADADGIVALHAVMRAGLVAFPLSLRFPALVVRELAERFHCAAVYVDSPDRAEFPGATFTRDDLRKPARPAPAATWAERPAAMVLTSGSTGEPKAAVHAFRGLRRSAEGCNARIPLRPRDRWLLTLPLHHVAGIGILFRAAVAGAAVWLPAPQQPLEEAILASGATHVSLVATQLYRLLQSVEGIKAAQSLKAILLGGGPAPLSLLARAHALGLHLYNSYGLTETASLVTATRPEDPIDTWLTAGQPLRPGTVAVSADGEILVSGETLFLGYAGGHSWTRTVDANGFFATGDLGYFDSAGNLCVTGRKDNMFISGGENIQPEEVERVLAAHPAIRQALVVPIADAEFGAVPVAFVQSSTEDVLGEAELRGYLAGALPRFKSPRFFFPWPEDPGGAAIKPLRRDMHTLAERLVQGTGLRHERVHE